MKKLVFGIFLLLVLTACSKEVQQEDTFATIKTSKQNNVNQSLIQSLGLDKVAMFDIELYEPRDVKYIEYWVEHYKDGKNQGRLTGAAMSVEPKEDEKVKKFTVSFARTVFNLEDETKYQRWNSSLSDGGTTASSQSLAVKVEDMNLSEGYSGIGDEMKVEHINVPVTLAYAVKDNRDSMTMTNHILGQDESELQEFVSKYKEVFLYRIMFNEEAPSH
ncbi:membrane lipoprotein lipid attachment site-containing protein [Cytobacillus suaedae]|nr:membrane lipoprotein lipid attachment site-containing protein [Cytobacillus suaedae]